MITQSYMKVQVLVTLTCGTPILCCPVDTPAESWATARYSGSGRRDCTRPMLQYTPHWWLMLGWPDTRCLEHREKDISSSFHWPAYTTLYILPTTFTNNVNWTMELAKLYTCGCVCVCVCVCLWGGGGGCMYVDYSLHKSIMWLRQIAQLSTTISEEQNRPSKFSMCS